MALTRCLEAISLAPTNWMGPLTRPNDGSLSREGDAKIGIPGTTAKVTRVTANKKGLFKFDGESLQPASVKAAVECH